MLETLQIGDYLLVTRFNYAIKLPFTNRELVRTGEPEYGDIIVFEYPKDPSQDYIKRVIGLPGDNIEIRGKKLFRNGVLISEPYVRISKPWSNAPGSDNMEKIRVPADQYFVLGDNRDESLDSRSWGFVPRGNIMGKALVIYWSWAGFSEIRWGRIGTILYPGVAAKGG